jgi:hypothetical protein
MKRTVLVVPVLAVCIAAAIASSRDFAMPTLVPATRMARRDVHAQEQVAIGADPYSTQQKASLFHPALLERSVLPVLVVFTNDGDAPIVLANARFKLITRDRAKAEPYSMDDLRRALTALRAPNSRPGDQIPVPLPGKNGPHGGLSARDRNELEHAMFAARDIAPHSSQQGFLFFDTTGLDKPAQGARLYVTGITDAHGHDLMYFEVTLEPQAAPPPADDDQ